MAKVRWQRGAWAIALGALITCACSAHSVVTPVEEGEPTDASDVDASMPDASDVDADDLDACVPTDAKKCRDASFIALGSKCLTKCPLHNLVCDPRFWKGECTHPCASDADCQDTGSPGVCGKDDQCHRPCSPGPKPCSRTHYDCVGDPGHQYCASSFPNPHLDGGDDGGDEAGDNGGDDGGN
jgi:hypothetical protein